MIPKKKPIEDDEINEDEEEQILGGGSTLIKGETTQEEGDLQEARQRDPEPDEYDESTNVNDERVRGAGEQSLEELTITRGLGLGLESHIGGLRHDRPEPNVNDREPESPEEEAAG